VKRKSWAAGQDRDIIHEEYVRYHLHQSESWSDISSTSHHQETTNDTTTTDDVIGSPEFPSRPITSLFSSARRRLGRRREATSPSNDVNNVGFELHRAPSSLFYLQYDDDEDDYDDDDDDPARGGQKTRRYSDLPSSRKLSAAAYLPRQHTPSSPGGPSSSSL